MVAIAVVCNASAQLFMKRAAVVDAFSWHQWLSPSMMGAVALYGLSFALTALVFARMPLSLISPLMAGAIFMLISLFSVVFLSETLDVYRVSGMVCIVLGIVLLSRGL